MWMRFSEGTGDPEDLDVWHAQEPGEFKSWHLGYPYRRPQDVASHQRDYTAPNDLMGLS
jgi:hypothetical protein